MGLTTTYCGLELKNPLIVGSGPLTINAKQVRKCAEAGAGAVVLKSLFEEQIRNEQNALAESLHSEEMWHAEVFAYMEAQIGMRYGTREYLQTVRDAKSAVDIPVIASINCVSTEWWQDFACEVAAAGADALELNIAIMPTDLNAESVEIEALYEDIVSQTRTSVSIPIAVKLAPYFTCPSEMIRKLRRAGADAFVLFNRLYRPTVDIETMKLCVRNTERYSTPGELSPTLRWISLLADRVSADYAAATGIHSGSDAVRALLVGAKAVQVFSALAVNGVSEIGSILGGIEEWMARHDFTDIESFRGLLSQERNPDTDLFGRVQYIKGLVGSE